MTYSTLIAHNYTSDRSSAESIAVGAALTAVRSGECQNMQVIWELDALEEMLAEGESDDEQVAEREREVMVAWQRYQRACGVEA
ncbi:MAG TPA: hypothetical protein VJN18_32665 [Polyangiaceae bacterium]|nr:hypothetical protein [Polyangiaceae bacterium]